MKPYQQLTYLGRIRRMRRLAQQALHAYGMSKAHFEFLRQAGNTLFRVREMSAASAEWADLYMPGEYMLRIHQPGYQATQGIELELMWLADMCRDEHIPVPEPIPARDGRLLLQVSVPGVPGERNVSLLRWVRGRFLPNHIGPHHYRAQGQLMARLHEFSSRWQAPTGFTKRKYDWDGLFQDDLGEGMSAREAWALLPPGYIKTYEHLAARVKQVMHGLGEQPQVYGLIHGDLGLDANILFWKGQARAIDFDDSGFGYYIYDLSLALEHCQEDKDLPRYRDALLDGYTRVRSLPDAHIALMDLFLAAYYVYLSLWAATAIQRYPRHTDELVQRMQRAFKLVQHLSDNCG